MNILVFSWRDPRHLLAGGAEQVMHEHMKGWVSAGHKVTLFSSRVTGRPNKETIDGVEIVRRGYQYLGVQVAGLFYYLRNRNRFDLVVDQFHGIPFFTPLYVDKPKLAVIQEPAREVWFANPLPWPVNWIVGTVGYLGEPLLFKFFYQKIPFITGSLSAKEELIKLGIPVKNIFIILHGIIIIRPSPFPKKGKITTIVYLGVLSKDKGIEDALRCFKYLDKKGEFKFWVIGKAETESYYKRIKRLVNNFGLSNKVKFWGFVSQKKKFELLAKAHILINPSIREGWGLVNVEANSMGTPVVAYRSPGLTDSVKDKISGILCKKREPVELAREVLKLTRDQRTYRKLRDGAIEWSLKFSWSKSRQLSLKLLRDIVREWDY